MTESLRILAVIPARGGSKRLPGKNKRLLGGKPLIVWSIESAQGIPEICDILVSTDDPELAEISKNAGALVPWLRPEELATDNASSVDVVIHAVDWYEDAHGLVDGVLLLQPTSPFRAKATIILGIAKFRNYGFQPVIGVSSLHFGSKWVFAADNNGLVSINSKIVDDAKSDALSVVNGTLYLISPDALRDCRNFSGVGSITGIEITSQMESLDIDTPYDWECAVSMLKFNEKDF